MSGIALPPFPADVCTHSLPVIDFNLLKAGDDTELDRLWKAATSIGFWYLKNHGIDQEANNMFAVGAETMALPLEEKLKFDQGVGGAFGYKKIGTIAVDASGNPDAVEFINISRDDVLAFPNVVHRTYPDPVAAAIPATVAHFVRKSLEVSDTIFHIFDIKLGFPKGTIARLHSTEEHSNTFARIIRSPPTPEEELVDRVVLGAHTDFGSLSFVDNMLGGLQVMPPGNTEWFYVKPLPGHTICNIGDSLSYFSAGILQSSVHRVVRPPGIQANYTRWSLVFLVHPGHSQVLRALVEDSPLVADAVRKHPDRNFDTGATASEWFIKRAMNRSISHRKGPESWAAGRGTEHTLVE